MGERLGVDDTDWYSPAELQMIEEMKANRVVPSILKKEIDEAFVQNEITPSVAQAIIDEINNDLDNKKKAFDGIIRDFFTLSIEIDELSAGEAALGVLMPRENGRDSLLGFVKEIDDLNKIITIINEYATGELGKSEIFELRAISSSDFFLDVKLALDIAAALSLIVAGVIASYKNVLDIKKHYTELREKEVPEIVLDHLKRYGDEVIDNNINEEIEKRIAELEKKKIDNQKINEIRGRLKFAMKLIATKIDCGFNFEVRVGRPDVEEDEPPAYEDGTPIPKAELKLVDDIARNQEKLKFKKVSGDRLLEAPEEDADDSEADEQD